MEDRTDKNQNKDKLTMSDWLAFLEARSGNYIAGMALSVSFLAIIAVTLSLLDEDIQLVIGLKGYQMILILLGIALLILLFSDILAGTPVGVAAVEARRISDMIIEEKVETVNDIKREWDKKPSNWWEWIKRKF